MTLRGPLTLKPFNGFEIWYTYLMISGDNFEKDPHLLRRWGFTAMDENMCLVLVFAYIPEAVHNLAPKPSRKISIM